MSPSMADFLAGLAGRYAADRWASQTLTAAGTITNDMGKANALLVHARLARQREGAGDTRRRTQPASGAVVQLAEQDLSGQDFSGQNLQGANLYNARLIEARLIGADLRRSFGHPGPLRTAAQPGPHRPRAPPPRRRSGRVGRRNGSSAACRTCSYAATIGVSNTERNRGASICQLTTAPKHELSTR